MKANNSRREAEVKIPSDAPALGVLASSETGKQSSVEAKGTDDKFKVNDGFMLLNPSDPTKHHMSKNQELIQHNRYATNDECARRGCTRSILTRHSRYCAKCWDEGVQAVQSAHEQPNPQPPRQKARSKNTARIGVKSPAHLNKAAHIFNLRQIHTAFSAAPTRQGGSRQRVTRQGVRELAAIQEPIFAKESPTAAAMRLATVASGQSSKKQLSVECVARKKVLRSVAEQHARATEAERKANEEAKQIIATMSQMRARIARAANMEVSPSIEVEPGACICDLLSQLNFAAGFVRLTSVSENSVRTHPVPIDAGGSAPTPLIAPDGLPGLSATYMALAAVQHRMHRDRTCPATRYERGLTTNTFGRLQGKSAAPSILATNATRYSFYILFWRLTWWLSHRSTNIRYARARSVTPDGGRPEACDLPQLCLNNFISARPKRMHSTQTFQACPSPPRNSRLMISKVK